MTRKMIALLALAAFSLYAFAQAVLLSGATATGAGTAIQSGVAFTSGSKQFQAFGQTTAGTGTAVITVQCSLDNSHWDSTPIGTISLTLGTVTVANSFTSTDRCTWLRGNVSTLTGTGSAATLYMGQ